MGAREAARWTAPACSDGPGKQAFCCGTCSRAACGNAPSRKHKSTQIRHCILLLWRLPGSHSLLALFVTPACNLHCSWATFPATAHPCIQPIHSTLSLTCARESLRLCAGSVLTMSVVCPAAARRTARDADRLVLPTPPLPLIMMYFRSVPAHNSSKGVSVVAGVMVAVSAAAAAHGVRRQRLRCRRPGWWGGCQHGACCCCCGGRRAVSLCMARRKQ